MKDISDDKAADSAKGSFYWVVKRVAVALGGAFALMVLGVATGSTLISLAALGFPFAVCAQSVAAGQRKWGRAKARLGRPLFDEGKKHSQMTKDERRRNGYLS